MNFLLIITLFFIHTLTANKQNTEKEEITVSARESLSKKPDSEDIVFVEPELALKDAIAESELVRSDHKRGEEFLINTDLHVDEQSISKSGVDADLDDVMPNNADTKSASNDIKLSKTDSRSISSEESTEPMLDEKTARKAELTDTSERVNKSAEVVRNAAEGTASVSEERVSVLKDTDKKISELVTNSNIIGRRMMQNEVLDTKAISGEEQELRVGVSVMPQSKIQYEVTLRPPELQRLPQPNMQLNRPTFLPFLPNRPVYYPNQDQSFRNLQTTEPPRISTEDLTNIFLRLNAYPAKERFQGSIPSDQFSQPSQLANTYNSPLLKNAYFMPTEAPPVNLRSSTLVNPIYMQTFTPSYDLQNFNRYDSLYRPRINM